MRFAFSAAHDDADIAGSPMSSPRGSGFTCRPEEPTPCPPSSSPRPEPTSARPIVGAASSPPCAAADARFRRSSLSSRDSRRKIAPPAIPRPLLAACGRTPDLEAIARISPWRFAAALSPDQAAAREGKTIDFAATRRFCAEAIATAEDIVLIEGIGGLMVPLDAQHTICDLIGALDVPLLLVAGTYLGSLSHTLTAIEVAKKRGLKSLALSSTRRPARPFRSRRRKRVFGISGPAPRSPCVIRPTRRTAHSATNAAAFEKLAEILP